MGTSKRKNSTTQAARTRAVTRRRATRKPVSTHPRAIAFAVATAFLPWYLPQIAYGQAVAPNQMPTITLKDGQAYIRDAAGTYQRIDQASLRAIYEGSMTMGVNAHLELIHAHGGSGIGLFRDVSGSLTQIFGRITTNGQVFISNQNGILFGASARVDVGSLFATSLSIKDHDFMAGRYNFYNEGNAGSVVNKAGSEQGVEGHIITANGYTALVGPQVRNDGLIVARAGNVTLAAGDRVTLDLVGDGLISLSIDQATFNASVVNTGRIEADGGTVLLAARSANALLDTVINNSGVIRANSLVERNGEIVLDGGNTGAVIVTGTLQAAGVDSGMTGGTVKVLGKYVGLVGSAKIDASGDAGGGTALIGGNFYGSGPEQNAFRTYVGQDVVINADAVSSGDGGRVAVWSDDTTRFYGAISARGGAQSGNGGVVEVSGRENLLFLGTVDTRAPIGRNGTLLLDPASIEIVGGATVQADDAELDAGVPVGELAGEILFGAGTEAFLISEKKIEDTGATTNITLEAKDRIFTSGTFDYEVAGEGTGVLFIQNGNTLTMRTRNAATDGDCSLVICGVDLTGGSVAIRTVGGSVTLETGTGASPQVAALTVGNINTSGANGTAGNPGGNGGAVVLRTADGNVVAGTIQTTGGDAGAGTALVGGNAGNVTIEVTGASATRAITTGGITATGGTGSTEAGAGNGGAGGLGGAVTVTADAGTFGA